MPPSPPEDPPGGPGAGGAPEEPLRRLEERLDRASDAAERLLSEAAGTAARAAKAASEIPAAGWQLPRSRTETGEPRDIELLAQLIESLRGLIPDELERRLAEALRELLLALRALIDWYLELGERRRATPTEVQDIPIA